MTWMFKHLRNYFFTGLFVLLPMVISLKLIFWGFEATDAILGDFINRHLLGRLQQFHLNVPKIPGIGLIALLALITVTGVFARNYLGKKLIAFGESVLKRIPVLNSVYNLIKQVTDGFVMTQSDKGAFRKVVMVQYPRVGVYSPGFLTGEGVEEISKKAGTSLIPVFVPTAPNPTTGFLIYIPATEVVVLDMSVEDGFKLVISLGMIKPSK